MPIYLRSVRCFSIRSFRLLLLVTVSLMLAEHCANAQAARRPDAAADRPITLDLNSVRMTDALTACCKQAGYACRVSDAIAGFVARERCTLHVQAVPFKTVFEALLAPGTVFARSYSYRKLGGVFLIEGPKVYADAKAATPAQILTSLLDGLEVNYVFPSDALNAPPMDFQVSGMPLDQALKLFLARLKSPQPLKYVTTAAGIFVFFNDVAAQKRPPVPKDVDPAAYRDEGLIMIKFRNVERLEAIRALFQVYQKNYSVNVPLKGTVSIEKELPFRVGLMMVLRDEVFPVTYKVENDMYTILRKYFQDGVE